VNVIGDLTMQLAEQALSTAKSPAPPPQPDNPCLVILGQVQAMQKALREDEELAVTASAAGETLRVLELFVPAAPIIVLKGLDQARNLTRVVSHVEALQLVCKVVKVAPPAKPTRIACIVARPKPE
jgi:hypothetical protein